MAHVCIGILFFIQYLRSSLQHPHFKNNHLQHLEGSNAHDPNRML